MKRSTITSIALLAALVGSSAASAASYDYTPLQLRRQARASRRSVRRPASGRHRDLR
jgi:hypothetical protein